MYMYLLHTMYSYMYSCVHVHVHVLFPLYRLDAIAGLAELQEKSLSELDQLATMLHDGCLEADNIYRQAAKAAGSELKLHVHVHMVYSLVLFPLFSLARSLCYFLPPLKCTVCKLH